MFENQPKGLYALALANTGERFGYYTMLAVFTLFLMDNFGWDEGLATGIYSAFLMVVYFLPLFGGMLADRIGFGKCVAIGITIMFFGYLLLAFPLGGGVAGIAAMGIALLLVCIGTSLFKGNLQVMVGNLYDDPKYASQRDNGFSIFYMAINIGAMFAASAAIAIMGYMQQHMGYSKADSYHFAFGIACLSLIISILIYFGFRHTFRHADYAQQSKGDEDAAAVKLTPAETRERIVALVLVFAVVIFFWMAFSQNGATLTYFADQFTTHHSAGFQSLWFNVWNLVAAIFLVYALFALFQSKTAKGRVIAAMVTVASVAILLWQYLRLSPEGITFETPIFQQFNPAFVVMLTPVTVAVFSALAKKGHEVKAPIKIALGMLVAAVGYLVMMAASAGLLSPNEQKAALAAGQSVSLVSPNWLISTYFILTCAELLLSPIGISFVSKVSPPQYKGMMMGGWFVATAIGNLLVMIPGLLWGGNSLLIVWGVLVAICLVSAGFIFAILKRLNKVA